jgi:hypothetical protein
MRHNSPVNGVCLLVVAAGITLQAGCTSALSTAFLRDALWDVAEHAAESAAEVPTVDDASTPDARERVAGDVAADRADADRRQAAIEEAVERLSRIGTLDAAAQTALVETLQATQQEDWPVVIEAFSATLTESHPAKAKAEQASEQLPQPHVVAKTTTSSGPEDAAATAVSSAIVVAPEPPVAPATPSSPAAAPDAGQPPEPPTAAVAPRFTVRNACFASRVRAWGDVQRLPDEHFRPGQEVIVYFELDGLSAAESPAGFRTSIDTALRLVGADGRELHAWKFDPITETCPARRHDYFARYILRLPESAVGSCRLEVAVTDSLAGTAATATLPCTVE